ncbi:hypothetical protein ACX40Y_01645 [Sphingomonas sp. RS6]
MQFRSASFLFVCVAAAGCVPAPRPAPPAPAPAPVVAPPPPVAAAPAPVLGPDWRDWALTPGDWVYRRDARGSIAYFGVRGAQAMAMLRCDQPTRRVSLSVPGDAPATLTVRTTSATRAIAAVPVGGSPPYRTMTFDARDPFLDAIGFSRGRFVIEGGVQALVIPAWPEILRVVEDCRG